jgi:hypothetical protein
MALLSSWGGDRVGEGTKTVSSGIPGAWDLISSLGFQEHSPVTLLPPQGNQTCRQWEPWGLIASLGFRECSSVALLPARRTKPAAAGVPGPDCCTGFREHGIVTLLLACAFCYPWSSRSCGYCLDRDTGFPGVSG